MTTAILVTMEHVRIAKLCSRGARAWFRHHGLDYITFIKDGLPVEVIEGTNDALGRKVADIARAHAAGETE